MKTFQITIRCDNAEGLREALEALVEEVSLSRGYIDALEAPDQYDTELATLKII